MRRGEGARQRRRCRGGRRKRLPASFYRFARVPGKVGGASWRSSTRRCRVIRQGGERAGVSWPLLPHEMIMQDKSGVHVISGDYFVQDYVTATTRRTSDIYPSMDLSGTTVSAFIEWTAFCLWSARITNDSIRAKKQCLGYNCLLPAYSPTVSSALLRCFFFLFCNISEESLGARRFITTLAVCPC